MKVLIRTYLLLVLLVLELPVFSQSVEDIIERNIEARGGKDRLAKVTTIYMEGSERQQDAYSISFSTVIEQGKLFRTDATLMGFDAFVLTKLDEKNQWKEYWKFDPYFTYRHTRMGDKKVLQEFSADIMGYLYNYKDKGYKAELLGKDSVKENVCYKIKLTPQCGSVNIYWIDEKSSLVIQQEKIATIYGDGTYEKMNCSNLISFSNYRSVDGIQFPFTCAQFFETATEPALIDTYYNNIKINIPIDPKLYNAKLLKKSYKRTF